MIILTKKYNQIYLEDKDSINRTSPFVHIISGSTELGSTKADKWVG